MTTSQLINQLVEEGGCIVTSNKCSEMEIADAQATGRFAVDAENGYGFVRRYEEWLQKAMTHSREHASQPARPADPHWFSRQVSTVTPR